MRLRRVSGIRPFCLSRDPSLRFRHPLTLESGNPAAADRFLSRIFEACESLSVLPGRFAAYPYAKRWRMMPFENYLVFFAIHENAVHIGHIRHGARRPFGG
jgi:plasmid stabilization system protein ParE